MAIFLVECVPLTGLLEWKWILVVTNNDPQSESAASACGATCLTRSEAALASRRQEHAGLSSEAPLFLHWHSELAHGHLPAAAPDCVRRHAAGRLPGGLHRDGSAAGRPRRHHAGRECAPRHAGGAARGDGARPADGAALPALARRSEEHTSELQSLMRNS